jgi:hypothetical protein
VAAATNTGALASSVVRRHEIAAVGDDLTFTAGAEWRCELLHPVGPQGSEPASENRGDRGWSPRLQGIRAGVGGFVGGPDWLGAVAHLQSVAGAKPCLNATTTLPLALMSLNTK